MRQRRPAGSGASPLSALRRSYGLSDADRARLVSAVRHNHEWSYDIVGTAAANGHAAFSAYWTGGAVKRAERTRRWYLDNAQVLQPALI